MAMWALEQPWIPRRDLVLADTPLAVIASLAAGWLVIASLARGGWVPAEGLGVVTLVATHGGLMIAALAWGEGDSGDRLPPGVAAITVALIALGAAAAAVHAWGAAVFVATPLWLGVLAYRRRLTGLGSDPSV